MMEKIERIWEIVSKTKYSRIFVLLTIGIGMIIAMSSNIVTPNLELNQYIDPIRAVIVAVIVALISLNVTIMFHNYEIRKKDQKSASVIGIIFGLFTSACPVCQPIWLIWFGLGAGTGFLADLGAYSGILSIIMLMISLNYSIEEKCKVKDYGKNN